MSRCRFAPAAALALLIAAFASATPSRAGGCEQFVGDNVYSCEVKGEDGGTFPDCIRFFSTFPTVSSKFDMFSDDLGDQLGCSCKTTGSFKVPHPNASIEFVCTSPDVPVVFLGKSAASHKIKNVQAVFSDGFSYVLLCTPNPLCSIGLTLSSSSSERPYHHR